MNSAWSLLLSEFLLNYWLHSSLFVGVALLAFKLRWISADSQGETIAKTALFAGAFTSLLFVADWRVLDSELMPMEMAMQLTVTQENGGSNTNIANHTITKESQLIKPTPVNVVNRLTNLRDDKVINEKAGVSQQHSGKQPQLISDYLITLINNLQWQIIILTLWLTIMLFVLCFKLVRISQLYWLLNSRKPVLDKNIIQIYSSLAQGLNLSCSVKLFESEFINSPIVFGQNEIVLPVGFSQSYQTDQIEAALAHEMAHLKRKDSIWQRVFVIFNSVFFFQPLNSLLVHRLYLIAEQQSDQLASLWTGNSRALAEALAITAYNHFNSSQSQWVPSMKSNKSHLLVRVEALLNNSQKPSSLYSVVLGTLLSIFVLTVMPGCSINQLQAKSFESGKVKHMSMTHSQNGTKIIIKAKLAGKIEFNDAETEIVKFPQDSYMDITFEKDGEDVKRLLIERKTDDEISYSYYVDGDKEDFAQNAKRWFASVLPQIFRVTGMDAEARVARIQKKGGDSAVLDEVQLIKGDFVQGLYMRHLYELTQLSDSDAYRSLELSQNLQSDFEQARVLKSFIKTQKLSNNHWQKLFKVSLNIQSDFELANLLKVSVSHLPSRGGAHQYFFDAAESIQSDFEMGGLFSYLLTEKQVSEQFIVRMLSADKNIHSDFELARLLIQANQKAKFNDDIFDAYLEVSENISSDFEMSRTFISLLDTEMDKAKLIKLMELASDDISSDFELARFLISLVEKQILDGELRAALLSATDNIGSSFERNRVVQRLKG